MPDSLKQYRKAIQKKPTAEILIGNHLSELENGTVKQNPNTYINYQSDKAQLFIDYLEKKITISAGAYAVKRSVFETIGFPEQLRNTEDIPFFSHCLALFDAMFLEAPLVKVRKHNTSLRHNFTYSKEIGTTLVDIIFNPSIIPIACMQYREKYYLKRCLSLMKQAYRAKDYHSVRSWYFSALKINKSTIINISALKRLLLSIYKELV